MSLCITHVMTITIECVLRHCSLAKFHLKSLSICALSQFQRIPAAAATSVGVVNPAALPKVVRCLSLTARRTAWREKAKVEVEGVGVVEGTVALVWTRSSSYTRTRASCIYYTAFHQGKNGLNKGCGRIGWTFQCCILFESSWENKFKLVDIRLHISLSSHTQES